MTLKLRIYLWVILQLITRIQGTRANIGSTAEQKIQKIRGLHIAEQNIHEDEGKDMQYT